MYSVGDKLIYGETGVCTIEKIAPLSSGGDKIYYHLLPLTGSGVIFCPVESGAFMRDIISYDEALALIDSIPEIEPAVCTDNRFNHVDAFYKDLFRQHTCEALVSIIKGLTLRMSDRKTKSSRSEMTVKRARDILNGELSVALGIDVDNVEDFISQRLGS